MVKYVKVEGRREGKGVCGDLIGSWNGTGTEKAVKNDFYTSSACYPVKE